MSLGQTALLVAVAAPWAAAVIIFALGERRHRARTVVGLTAALTASVAAVGVAVAAASGDLATIGVPLLGTGFALAVDRLGALFAVVAAVLWLVTTVYATGYMSHGANKARFFGFFAVCVGSAIGIALSANLLTLFVFYEALTLATYPLVVHSGNDAAIKGGRTYLAYALTGGTALALGVIWLYSLGGGVDFAAGPVPQSIVVAHPAQLTIIFALLMAGFGVKAALFPGHGWLPAAMVAPAPVSALLHAVAVVKAGVFGIARVVLDVYGFEAGEALGVLGPLAALAAFTILFASVRALAQDDIKKRLAYSTIGQLSYIVLGLALGTPVAAAAAVAHLAHHAVLKITMFFTAGVLAEELHIKRVSQMDGVGRRMPLTMIAFTVAALGITGVPPIAGFVTKWGLGTGALDSAGVWPLVVLAASTLLNAAYFMPMLGRAWFGRPPAEYGTHRGFEGDRRMVLPLALTALAGLVFGPLAGLPWSPASWAAVTVGAAPSAVVPWAAGDFTLDRTGALFAVLAVIVWLASAIASWRVHATHRSRFWTFLALSAAGSVVLAFATGPAVFYAAFSVMALSAYGLVAQDGTQEAHRAGRAYLAFTLVAEAVVLSGLLIGAQSAAVASTSFAQGLVSSPWRDLGIAALLVAFGIKVGMPLLGGWMPIAYGATPRGVGAAVAGVVSSAGVLGMIRFMPGGVVDLPRWGAIVMTAGVVAAFYGAVAGVVQRAPRHVLAYSSMSQFGLMTIGVGAGLSGQSLWPAAVAAIAVYVVHHGLAKAALFAGADAVAASGSRRIGIGLALPALALAGLPLTSGAVAKVALKGVVAEAPASWAHFLEMALPLAAVGTTALMARFIYLSARRSVADSSAAHVSPVPGLIGFGLLLLMAGGFMWVIPDEAVRYAAHKSLTGHYLWVLGWPVAAGVVLSAAVFAMRGVFGRLVGVVAPGDVWAAPLRALDDSWVRYQTGLANDAPTDAAPTSATGGIDRFVRWAGSVERHVLTWSVASTAIVALATLVLLLSL